MIAIAGNPPIVIEHAGVVNGLPNASVVVAEVAAEMGLSEAAIHRYTGSKEDLFVPAIRQVGALVHALFPASAVAAGGR